MAALSAMARGIQSRANLALRLRNAAGANLELPLGVVPTVTAVIGPRSVTAGVLTAAIAVAGWGSSSDTASPPPANKADFPQVSGRTLPELAKLAPQGPVLVPSVSTAFKGPNRLGFGLFTRDQKQINGAQVVVYTADKQGNGVKGPYPAHFESLAVKPQFQSRSTASDPDAAKGVYVAQVPFARNGPATLLGMAKINGK